MLSTGIRSPPAPERGAYLAGLNCEPHPAPAKGHPSAKGGLSPALPAQPCLPSGNAYAPVRHFFKASKAVNFTPNEMRSSWWSGGGRLFARRQGSAHGRELPSHHRNSAVSGVACTQKAWMHQAAMKELYFDRIVYENTVLPSNSGDYTGCRRLIIMFWAPHSCPGQPSTLKAVMGHYRHEFCSGTNFLETNSSAWSVTHPLPMQTVLLPHRDVQGPTPVLKARKAPRASTLTMQPATGPELTTTSESSKHLGLVISWQSFYMCLYSWGYKTGSHIIRASYNIIKNTFNFIAFHIS